MCHVDIRLRSIHSPASIGKGRNPVCPSSPPVFLRASGILPLALRCLGSSATHGSEYIAMLLSKSGISSVVPNINPRLPWDNLDPNELEPLPPYIQEVPSKKDRSPDQSRHKAKYQPKRD